MERETAKVIFRAFKDGGAVIAVFPEIHFGRGLVQDYMHVGQYGESEYSAIISITRPAKENEYLPLKKELESLGYDLILRKKARVGY